MGSKFEDERQQCVGISLDAGQCGLVHAVHRYYESGAL